MPRTLRLGFRQMLRFCQSILCTFSKHAWNSCVYFAFVRCQIVATGSNAYIFSSELSTRLSGLYIEVPIHSLTYREFLRFHGLENTDKSLLTYLRAGGLPGLCHYDMEDENQIRDYLQGVYNTIMLRDVIAREEIRNVAFIENDLPENGKSRAGGGLSRPSCPAYINHIITAPLGRQASATFSRRGGNACLSCCVRQIRTRALPALR